MKTRIITAIVALLIFIPILIFADVKLLLGVTLLNLALALLSCVGTLEAINCIGVKNPIVKTVSCLLSFLLVLFAENDFGAYIPAFAILLFLLLFLGVFKNESIACDNLLCVFALTFYVTVSFGAISVLYNHAATLFPLIFIGAWVTDTFAYFTGYFLGKHKLIPSVSPKKTIEGALGGSLACTIVFAVYALIISKSITQTLIFALIGLITSVISQLGDLAASLFKRHWGIKDYGSLFPGHGGVLDRFDSILAVSVFLYIISHFIEL